MSQMESMPGGLARLCRVCWMRSRVESTRTGVTVSGGSWAATRPGKRAFVDNEVAPNETPLFLAGDRVELHFSVVRTFPDTIQSEFSVRIKIASP